MKVLELFAGTRSIGKEFEKAGHEVFSVDYDKQHKNIDLYIDIMELTAEMVLEKFGRPEIIWCSPDCTSYSIAAISHHRTKEVNGNLAPVSDYAKFSDKLNQHVHSLIEQLKPKYWFIENPRGGMRKMNWMKDKPIYTVWYCQYGDTRAKPTDLWTNHPNPKFKPVCRNGNPNCHHQRARRGAKTGTQGLKGSVDRSRIPEELCKHIVKLCEEENNNECNQNLVSITEYQN
jgi:site-specific DNA-cytosine methylase